MTRKARKQTSEKTRPRASGNEVNANVPQKGLGGDNPRGEVAGCPTGLAENPQAQQPQRAGGGGAPGTGDSVEQQDRKSYTPDEGLAAEQAEQSEAKD